MKQPLAHWLCEAFTQVYYMSQQGKTPPLGIHAHFPRALSSSIALLRGIAVADICAATSWASLCPFIQFHLCDASEFLIFSPTV